jgi:hypothetical protein
MDLEDIEVKGVEFKFTLTCELKLPINRWIHKIFNWNEEWWIVELRFELVVSGFDTKLNHHLSQKLELIGRDKFNYLINIFFFKKKKVIEHYIVHI